MYECKIIKDSVGLNGVRLTTFEVTYPLIIHAEMMTHRVFSRNVASNRAIPVAKLVKSVQDNPFIPERFPQNKSGMQNKDWLEGWKAKIAKSVWLLGRTASVWTAKGLMKLGVHKQIANRVLAPWLWTTMVLTATDFDNFEDLRVHEMAQPEIFVIAKMMKEARQESVPELLKQGEWHLPYISDETKREAWDIAYRDIYSDDGTIPKGGWESFRTKVEDKALEICILVSIGRCARVSYLNHGEGNPLLKDLGLAETLIDNKHMSPTEHVATPLTSADYCGNFRGWKQYRKTILGESGQNGLCSTKTS